jgi:hypothetical protein
MSCSHARTHKWSEVYEYCEDCGAVRTLPRPGERLDTRWHSCDLCRLPVPFTQNGVSQGATIAQSS